MWNRHNVHKMFINIYRNPKTRNWFRYGTFIHLFEFKGFSTWGKRERQSLYADCFYIVSSQPNQRAAPVAHKFVCLAQLWISTLSFGGWNSTLCFFSNSPNLQPTLPVHDVTHIPKPQFLSGIFILISLNDTTSPRAREHMRQCLHRTNPCTEPKGSHSN